MHDIPNDVLGEIFLRLMNLSVPESIFSTKDLLSEPDIEDSITSIRSFQSILTSICRQWRAYSISNARLWTTLAFIAPDHVISTEIGRRLAWEVMEREISRSCQRRVTILCNLTNDTHVQTAATFLERILQLAAARGEVVWLNLALPVAELVGKESVGGSIRHLRICMDPPAFSFQKVNWVPRFVANNSRTLTELHAPSNLVVDAPIERGNMTQLQTLHFEDSISSSVLVNHGMELRSLHLLELTHNSDTPRIRPILPVLTHLRFYSTRGHYLFSTVLDILTLPALRSIDLRSYEPWPMQPSIDSFHRSQCQLTRLAVHGLITGMIIDVLKIFDQTLVELTMVILDARERDDMIGILFDYIANSTITTLPSLQRLVLQTNPEQIPACERMLLTRVVNW
ncbi:hypothetical protein BDZ89DRAFT_308780 [Hymenopellis radicata]|nr:hypothetical protein BDZ89DRAFT_308780 [Hymenopellis radicata]